MLGALCGPTYYEGNMSQKMTDEELSEAKRALHSGDSSEADWTDTWGDAVFAHIAAVTAERNGARSEWAITRDKLDASNSECSALREGVREVERERDGWRCSATSFREQRDAAESRLSAILGDDAPAPHEEGHVSGCPLREEMTPDGVPCACASIVAMTGMAARVVSSPPPTCATHPDPTTAEAFATARAAIDAAESPALNTGEKTAARRVGKEALSLLERRMGAKESVLRALLSSGVDSQWVEGGRKVGLCAMARSALTDAPPVFTLEEVDASMSKAGVSADECMEIRAHLKSLRK